MSTILLPDDLELSVCMNTIAPFYKNNHQSENITPSSSRILVVAEDLETGNVLNPAMLDLEKHTNVDDSLLPTPLQLDVFSFESSLTGIQGCVVL